MGTQFRKGRNISIMFPMIISAKEAKRILEEVKEELKKKEVPYQDVETGIMIETPGSGCLQQR